MRKLAVTLALSLAAAPLGACAALPFVLGGESLAQTAPATTADAEKALTLAHLAYQGVGLSLQNAAESGALQGANAAKAKALYDKAGAALDAADAADAAANAPGMLAAIADANGAIAQLGALVKK